MLCPVIKSCCGCKETKYIIRDTALKKEIGSVINIDAGCAQELCTTADNFLIKFPNNANIERKILLIMATIFLNHM